MAISNKQYAEALRLAFQEASPKDHDKVIENFINVLKENGDLGKYEAIIAEFEQVDLEAQGVKKAQVTFAREMEVNKKIVAELNEIVGSKVEVETKIDEGMIGGMVVRVDDTLIDASVKGQLNRLGKELLE